MKGNKKLRPVLRYYGGKWMMAPWIISHFPPHRNYIEPFGGAASVLLRKAPSFSEVYNDLDDEIVNLFMVLRNEKQAVQLKKLLQLTPFSRTEFYLSQKTDRDPIEQARRTIVRSFMGFGSDSHTRQTGFRNDSRRSGSIPAHDWKSYPIAIEFFVDRLKDVVIEKRPAINVIQQHDDENALHYLDPPYQFRTRSEVRGYRFEMTDDNHRELAEVIRKVKGMVIVSGYPSDLYDKELYSDWFSYSKNTYCNTRGNGASPRTERIWMNESCHTALKKSQAQQKLLLE